jgi:4-nitrophenol 2-monooxygenase / 4-nitrocatechol 4-monooxygenase, reductase component
VHVQRASLSADDFREVVGHFASGVTVVTAVADGTAFGTTASAVTSLSVEPPMMLICMNRTSQTGQAIARAGHFAINILAEDQPDAAVHFAGKSADKFAGVETTAGLWGQPLLRDALATLECRVVEQTQGGTHLVFFGEVDAASARQGAPLAYFRGRFGRLELAADDGS